MASFVSAGLTGQSLDWTLRAAGRAILFPVVIPLRGEGPVFALKPIGPTRARKPSCADVRICSQESIVGHGRRRKQAHDEDHDWIQIRRGVCNLCGKTLTFLPPFFQPYCHYSLIAPSQALRLYFVEGCCWETPAPAVKDPDRLADPSTLRRWSACASFTTGERNATGCSWPTGSLARPHPANE